MCAKLPEVYTIGGSANFQFFLMKEFMKALGHCYQSLPVLILFSKTLMIFLHASSSCCPIVNCMKIHFISEC